MVAAVIEKNGAGRFRNKLQRLMGASCLVTLIGLAASDQGFAASGQPIIPRETSTIPANGDLISSQGDAINASSDPAQQSEIVEFTKGKGGKPGTFVSQFSLDSATGAAFGIAIQPDQDAITLAAVDDSMNVVTLYNLSGK